MIDPASVARLVDSFQAGSDFAAAKSQELIAGMLRHTPHPFSRKQFTPGHITCTGLVLHPDGQQFLIIHHRSLDRWLLPGGHVEPEDAEIWQAARREVEEETTVVLAPAATAPLVGIDVHGIPPNKDKDEPFHLHHDLIFAFRAASADVQPNQEVRAARWHMPLVLDHHLAENIALAAKRAAALLG